MAFGAAIYLRVSDADDKIHLFVVCSKARVPLNCTTLPRLCAAVHLADLYKFVHYTYLSRIKIDPVLLHCCALMAVVTFFPLGYVCQQSATYITLSLAKSGSTFLQAIILPISAVVVYIRVKSSQKAMMGGATLAICRSWFLAYGIKSIIARGGGNRWPHDHVIHSSTDSHKTEPTIFENLNRFSS